jgi:DNA ligase-1
MYYSDLATTYSAVEQTSGTLDKIEKFSELLTRASADDIEGVIALTMGKIHPDWKDKPEVGIAERVAVQIVAAAAGVPESEVTDSLRDVGDIGEVAEQLLSKSAQATLFSEDLSPNDVYEALDEVAHLTGPGSAREKISKMVGLLSDSEPLEAKYILRTAMGDLRLGLGDMTIIDSLSVAFTGDREARSSIERAYNVSSDLPWVARVLLSNGFEEVTSVHPQVGRPIRMMAAKKLATSEEILEKVGGQALVEYKYDGERVQAHKDGDKVVLFSRRQERITSQYPDVVEMVTKHLKPEVCIVEAEIVAIDPDSLEMRPFQELMRRRRKTDISEMRETVPVALYLFDILYVEGEDVMDRPMLERRTLLEEAVSDADRVRLTSAELVNKSERLDEVFKDAVATGHEGVIAKAVHDDSVYQAGSRSWLWIKLKASYKEGMADSVDLVVVGAFHGRGKRTGLYGAILAAVYDETTDNFPTVCKIGTGFTDEMLVEMKQRLDDLGRAERHPRVESDLDADVWFDPELVIEVIGDEITVSPTHVAGKGILHEGGLAIRFPRFTGRWRDDKSPNQATTVEDLVEMYKNQKPEGP